MHVRMKLFMHADRLIGAAEKLFIHQTVDRFKNRVLIIRIYFPAVLRSLKARIKSVFK